MSKNEFATKLAGNGSSLSYIEIPKKVMASFGGKKRVPVNATLNGYSYRTTICTMGGITAIPVCREHREGAKVAPGDRVQVVLKEDLAPRTVTIPSDLLRALKSSKSAFQSFRELSYTHQKEFVEWVTGAKKAETRARRVAGVLQKL